jgi:DNA topoisomerase-1
VESFSDVINEEFTAQIEAQLDDVEEKGSHWQDMVGSWFFPFQTQVNTVMETLESVKGSMDEPTGVVCEKCGKPMVKKLGRFGEFLACTGFPECRNAKSIPLAKCPKCGVGDIVTRKTKGRGRDFYGCTRYPECDFMTHFKPLDTNCPKCGWFMVERYDKKQGNYKSCINPACDYLHSVDGEESHDGD